MNIHQSSFDVWDPAPVPDEGERELPVWLGYVATEYVQDYGLVSHAYRATSYWQYGSGSNGVPMDAYDTADDAEQAIRDYWEV